ncbi:putative ArsR family transcriptional regulator [Friedmanniella endophytica]|uniref:Putative ArsR family transcriptional regulator n=1 Tax=Microlunatus kandeliicorticis TaxID=1759536 RepID=A0A7W3IVI0_9ACTN|nr:helix-turn-helix domain-containing protein [Microlunatus kandeliicorticis]MBA8795984.1 putative ArsR family transcriptional regulator [Microlunatus kandeliicorticis]
MTPRRPEIVEDHGLPLRRLRSPEQLRALAHPRRMQLIDLLVAEGPLTASECAARLEDSAASCSYHLRQLARFGFVEEADGGQGRNRPWRFVPVGNRIETSEDATPAERSARESVENVLDGRADDRIRRWRAHRAADPWRDAAEASDYTLRLTEDELRTLGEQIAALLMPLQRRTFDGEAPADARLVDVFTYLLPRPEDRRA